jgi:hypothetical protein
MNTVGPERVSSLLFQCVLSTLLVLLTSDVICEVYIANNGRKFVRVVRWRWRYTSASITFRH